MIRPKTEHVKIFKSKDSIFGYHGWLSVCRGLNGELISVCSGNRLGHVCPFGKVLLSRSYDEGIHWTAPEIIIDTPLDDRDAGITVFNKDKIIVTSFNHLIDVQSKFPAEKFKLAMRDAYFSNNQITKEMEKKYFGSTYVISEDKGITWSEVMHAPVTCPHGPAALKDGGLIYMGYYKEVDDNPSKYDENLRFKKELLVFYSKDGLKWDYLSHVPYVTDEGNEYLHCEPYILELEEKLVGFIRVQGGIFATYMTESYDKGKTWSVPVRINKHGAPAHAIEHSCGAVVLVYGYREQPYGQRAMVSYDRCKTWSDEIILRDDGPIHDLGYPASVELNDGKLLTVYYQKETLDSQCEIFGTFWELPKNEEK